MSDPVSTPTPSEAPGGAAADAALCRGVLYSAVSLGFRPPTSETRRGLAEPEALDALVAAASGLESSSPATGIVERVRALAGTDHTRLDSDYRALFGHTARGAVPAYETEYGNEALFQQPQQLADLAGFMSAFGLELRAETHERADHVSCECELMAFLSHKEAYAIDTQDDEMLVATRRASELFLRDHLGRIAPAFAQRVGRTLSGSFHDVLAALMLAVVKEDCARLGVRVGPEALGLRPDPATVSAPMGCGTASEGGCPGEGCDS